MGWNKAAIVGCGSLGGALGELFPDAARYDEPLGIGSRDEVNLCRFAFVCVPTPQAPDGACDLSIVEDVVSWIESDIIIICSTVAVGTTDRLRQETGKRIVFNPAYGPGETPDHPFHDFRAVRWITLGGAREDTTAVADLYKKVFNADITIRQADARTAELAKYMENAYLAAKVTFCNEFYELASVFGVDYNELRELWLLDPRMGRSHTFVLPDARGYGGKCLPKDVAAVIASAESAGYSPDVLIALRGANEKFRGLSRVE